MLDFNLSLVQAGGWGPCVLVDGPEGQAVAAIVYCYDPPQPVVEDVANMERVKGCQTFGHVLAIWWTRHNLLEGQNMTETQCGHLADYQEGG